MNYQETKKKVVNWCEELEKEGVISKNDLDKCYKSFVSFGSETTVQKHPEAQTNKKHSFAMQGKQGENSLGEDLTKHKYLQCLLKTKYGFTKTDREGNTLKTDESNYDDYRYLTIRENIDNEDNSKTQLYLASDNNKDILLSRYVLTLQDNGLYTLMNYGTGNYLKVEADKRITIDTNNITDGAYFEMTNNGKYVVFSPRVFPEFKLTPKVNKLVLTDGKRPEHNWIIEKLPEEEEIAFEDSNFNTVKLRDTVQKIISEMIKVKYEYYGYLSKIEFLKLLQIKLRNMVKTNGDIMNALYNRREDATSSDRKILTEELLRSISFSIKEELENREIAEINDEIDNLIIESKKFKSQSLDKSDAELNKLILMLTDKIEENKKELESQRQLIGFYNKEQKSLNNKSDKLKTDIDVYNDKSLVNSKNYQIISEKQNILNKEYYMYIIIILVSIGLIGFFGYKLYNSIKSELS